MKFKRQIKLESGLAQIDMAPLIDVVFLLLIFFMLSSSFTFQSGIHVKLPKAVTSDIIKDDSFTITITSENVIYLNGNVVSLEELQSTLIKSAKKDTPVMIKADRRSSMGRIVDVWDLCRERGIEKINIATNRDL
ncbi:MAG: biopolymer transporter ExbD [Candidatus Omnitrophota bacterium]